MCQQKYYKLWCDHKSHWAIEARTKGEQVLCQQVKDKHGKFKDCHSTWHASAEVKTTLMCGNCCLEIAQAATKQRSQTNRDRGGRRIRLWKAGQ